MGSAVTVSGRAQLPTTGDHPQELGRYVVRRQIGQGGMGRVFAAYDPRLDRDIALKVLRRSGRGAEPDWSAVLIREARALARLAHPNVIAVYDVGLVEEDVFIAMELVEGVSLKSWLEESTRPWRDAIRLFIQAGRGLAAAHDAGLVHRDFKPENCLFGSDGRVRVVDFGLVRRTKRARPEPDEPSDTFRNLLTGKKDVDFDSDLAGTPRYMAPEMFRGGEVTEHIDQFAFSVALWEALLGTHPFPFETVFQFVFSVTDGKPPLVPEGSEVPEWTLEVLRRGLLADPHARFPSMTAMLAALEDGLSQLKARAPRIGWRYEVAGDGRARDRLNGRNLAVERIDRILEADTLSRLSRLSHPNLARVTDFSTDEAGTHLMLELPEGTSSIADLADRPASVIIPYLAQLLRALDYLHRSGLAHGDLRPERVRILSGHVLLTGLSAQGGALEDDLTAARAIARSLLLEHAPSDLAELLSREDGPASARELASALGRASGQPVEIETPETRESILQTAPLIGRSRELAELTSALDEAFQGRGGAITISGESGVGKSRLLRELAVIARTRGALVLFGQAEGNRGRPFALWREPLASLALAAPLSDDEASALRMVLPDLEHLLERSVSVPPELPAATMQARLRSAILGVVARHDRPVVMLLEDVHWARSESKELLEGLTLHALESRLLLVASVRDDERGVTGDLSVAARTIEIARLDPPSMAALGESVLGEAARRPEIARFLERETEGNAFFLVEAMRALAEEAGGLDRLQVLSEPPKHAGGGSRRALERRLSRVGAEDWPLLELAALAGREIDRALLAALRPDDDLSGWLDRCERATVLGRRDGRHRFTHDKLRESIAERIGEQEAIELNRRIALALERLYGDTVAASLADHFGHAGDRAREAHYAELAGTQALHTSAAEARPHLLRALELLEPDEKGGSAIARIHRRLGEACYQLADFDGAEHHLARSLALLGHPPPRSGLGWVMLALRQLLVQLGHRWFEPGRTDDPRLSEASRAAGRLAKSWAHRPNPMRLMSMALLAENLAERAGQRNVYALGLLGYAAGMLGLKKLPASYFEKARAAEVKNEDSVEAFVMETIYLASTGRRSECLRTVDEGLSLARALGDRFGIASLEAARGHANWFFGNVGEVSACFDRAVTALATGDSGHLATFELGQALGLYLDGRVAEAEPIAQSALARVSEMDHSIRVSGLAVFGLIQLELGNVHAAASVAESVFQIFSDGRLVAPIFFHVPMLCFEAHLAAGQDQMLERTLAFERAWIRNAPLGEPQVHLHEGKMLRRRGDEAGAKRSFDLGIAVAKHLASPAYEGMCWLELGRAERAAALFEESGFGLYLRKARAASGQPALLGAP